MSDGLFRCAVLVLNKNNDFVWKRNESWMNSHVIKNTCDTYMADVKFEFGLQLEW